MKKLLYFLFQFVLSINFIYSQGSYTQKGDGNIMIVSPTGTVTIKTTIDKDFRIQLQKDINSSNKDLVNQFTNAVVAKFDILSFKIDSFKRVVDSIKYGINQNNKLVSSFKFIEEKIIPDSINKNKDKYYSIEKLNKNSNVFLPINKVNNFTIVKHINKYGMINASGKLLLDYKYDFIEFKGDTNYIAVSRNNEGYYINTKEEITLKISSANKVYCFQDSIARVVVNGKYGVIRKDGKFSIIPEFDYLNLYEYGIASVGKVNNKGGFLGGLIKSNGKTIVPIGYRLDEINDKYYVFHKQSKNGSSSTYWGWIVLNKRGTVLLAEKHMHPPILSTNSKKCISLTYSNKKLRNQISYLFDSVGNVILHYNGHILSFANDSLLVLSSYNRYEKKFDNWIKDATLIDVHGKTVLADNYCSIKQIKDSIFVVSRFVNDKLAYGVVNIYGLEVLPFMFSSFDKYKNDKYIGNILFDDYNSKKYKKESYKERVIRRSKYNVIFDNNFQCVQYCEQLKNK